MESYFNKSFAELNNAREIVKGACNSFVGQILNYVESDLYNLLDRKEEVYFPNDIKPVEFFNGSDTVIGWGRTFAIYSVHFSDFLDKSNLQQNNKELYDLIQHHVGMRVEAAQEVIKKVHGRTVTSEELLNNSLWRGWMIGFETDNTVYPIIYNHLLYAKPVSETIEEERDFQSIFERGHNARSIYHGCIQQPFGLSMFITENPRELQTWYSYCRVFNDISEERQMWQIDCRNVEGNPKPETIARAIWRIFGEKKAEKPQADMKPAL